MIKLYFFRLKLILVNKLNISVILLSFVIFLILMDSLSFGAIERSNVPVGILDLDQSKTSIELVKKVKKVPVFYVYEEEENELNRLLVDEEVSGIFIIKKGFEDSIKRGITTELVIMKYLEGNPSSKVLTDIFAGQMLYPISLAKSLKEYETLKKSFTGNTENKTIDKETQYNWFTGQEYVRYINQLSKASDFDFAFDINIVDLESANASINQLDNSVIYYQVVFGILGMIISFVAMFLTAGVVVEKEQGLYKKIRITLIKPIQHELSYILALVTILSVFSFGIILILVSFIENITLQKGCIMFSLLLLYAMVMGIWFITLGKIIRKVSKYQLLGTLSILSFGLLSFLSMLEGLLQSKIFRITKILPNRWLMEGITDIAFNNAIDKSFHAFWSLLVMGLILFLLSWFVEMFRKNAWE